MINLLFVCMGNICRSPAAEGVMKDLVEKEGLSSLVNIDSAGIIGYHEGENADARMIQHARKRNIILTSKARQIRVDDFRKFDYIITMDNSNYDNVLRLDKNNEYREKVLKMTEFLKKYNHNEVPDPYYGGSGGFELVLDLLDDACSNFLEWLKIKHTELNIG